MSVVTEPSIATRRRRIALAVVAVVGISGCGGGSPHIVAQPPGKRGLLPASSQLSDRIVFPRNQVRAGASIRGEVIVVNRGRRSIKLLTNGCRPAYAVGLANRSITPLPAFTSECLTRPLVISPGDNRLPVSVSASFDTCSQAAAQATARSPACLPGGRLPPLPPGPYRAVLIGTGLALPDPAAVTVVVTNAQGD